MLNLIAILAAAAVQASAPAQPPVLEKIAGVKLHPYPVTGLTTDAIQKSMKAAMKSQPKTIGQLYTWTASINVSRATEGSVCTVQSATAALDANVYLPQLADETKLAPADLKEWKAYEAGIREDAANNLEFVADRLPTIERSLVGKPCDQAATIWNQGITALIAQQQAFDRQNSKKKQAAKAPFNEPVGAGAGDTDSGD